MSAKRYDAAMKDADLRGLVIESLYDQRKEDETRRTLEEIGAVAPAQQMPMREIARIVKQLHEYGLVEAKISRTFDGEEIHWVRITARGIDVAEGTSASPITVTIHTSNAIIGDHGTITHSPDSP